MRRLAPLALLVVVAVGCEPAERVPPRSAKPMRCPPPPEPAYQAAVVGTIGKMHLVESRYPLSRLGDVLAAFKPELVLVGVRVDAFREGRLEDASFEMTYVTYLARQHGVMVEPIDWFREQDLGAPAAPVEPWDAADIARKETEVLAAPRLYNFEQANGAPLFERVIAATAAEARYRGGNPIASRRQAWVQHLAVDAVTRHGKPKRVLAYVDVLDRPAVDLALHGVAYAMSEPAAIAKSSKEEMVADVPADVVSAWRAELARVRERQSAAEGDAGAGAGAGERAFWSERARVLQLAVEKRGACCVTQAAVGGER